MSPADRSAELRRVLEELLATSPAPDAGQLEAAIQRLPEEADEITDFTVEWLIQELLPAASEPPPVDAPGAVDRAMARLESRWLELDPPVDPFAGLGPGELRRLGRDLDLDTALLVKLRDRRLVAESVPDELVRGLGERLGVAPEVVRGHLAAPAAIHGAARFKAPSGPRAGAKESFADAVRRSALAEPSRRRWLGSADADG